jgi:hypothetical protein
MPDATRASNYQWYDERALQHRARNGDQMLDRPAFPGDVNSELKDHSVMKARTSRIALLVSFGAVSLLAPNAPAQTPAPEATVAPAPAVTEAAPAKLPYGVEDVVKLSRAQVSEDVTLSFIRNSGTVYNLAPKDIVYLRNEGVSDRVINAMLDQGKSVPTVAGTQAAPTTAPSASVPVDPNAAAAAQAQAQYAPAYTQQPVYVQPDASYVPPSTVYSIPYSTPAAPYYYSGYPYYYGPSIGIGFGFGYGGYYRGYGYRGGYYHGGSYHGGHYGGHYGHR